ncbi:1437_t:CDS:1 [Acaulospora morrowiae]|uniref:1437_t:CDS:1 n=1 Tax=Acaulospora morrowiae TaxID=94023 RepID=A0A9N9G2H3_9GLOM|nr:1437_t:CDS:1 [Acaulospora morrowiae]
MASFVDLPHIYNLSVNKFHNFHEREGLRKFALLNNFLYTKFEALEQEPFEWSEEEVKKDEMNWFDACLDSLDEEENGYVYIKLMNKDDAMELEGQDSDIHLTEDIIIPEDLLHLPYFVPDTVHMAIDQEEEETFAETYETVDTNPEGVELKKDEDINMVDYSDTSSDTERSFHPYWKDNSIIASSPADFCRPFPNSNGMPRLFQRYRLGRDDFIMKPLDSRAVLGLLDHKRSKDDLDILCSFAPRDLDQGALMDVISMLECRGEKKNDDSKKNPPLSSLEDDKIWFIR